MSNQDLTREIASHTQRPGPVLGHHMDRAEARLGRHRPPTAKPVPEIVAELESSPDVSQLKTTGPCEHGGLFAAYWAQWGPHGYSVLDTYRLSIVFFLNRSRTSIAFDGKRVVGDGGHIRILPPGTPGGWQCTGSMEYLQVCLPEPFAVSAQVSPKPANDPVLLCLGLALVDVLKNDAEQLDRAETTAWSTVLGSHLARRYGNGKTTRRRDAGNTPLRSSGQIQTTIQFIDDHIHETLSVAQLASLAGMSRSKFSQIFKISTGMSPYQFVVARRVLNTRQLLSSSPLSLSDIAQAVGFSSQSHMTSTFHRLTGATPQEYRTKQKPLAGLRRGGSLPERTRTAGFGLDGEQRHWPQR